MTFALVSLSSVEFYVRSREDPRAPARACIITTFNLINHYSILYLERERERATRFPGSFYSNRESVISVVTKLIYFSIPFSRAAGAGAAPVSHTQPRAEQRARVYVLASNVVSVFCTIRLGGAGMRSVGNARGVALRHHKGLWCAHLFFFSLFLRTVYLENDRARETSAIDIISLSRVNLSIALR